MLPFLRRVLSCNRAIDAKMQHCHRSGRLTTPSLRDER
jgi:hypothetical protein